MAPYTATGQSVTHHGVKSALVPLRPINVNTVTATTSTTLNSPPKKRGIDMIDLANTTTPPKAQDAVEPEADLDRISNNPKRIKWNTIGAFKKSVTTISQPVQDSASDLKRIKRVKQEEIAAQSVVWRAKYKKVFPTFVFYFDSLDYGQTYSMLKQVERLGASVDTFFSKKVTHVVTTRPVPLARQGKENSRSPASTSTKASQESNAGPSRTKKSSVRSPMAYALASGQRLQSFGEGAEKNPFIDSQDILSKAVDFGLKIWTLDKLHRVLTMINSRSPNAKAEGTARNQSLPALLREEQLYGTRERDPFVPRSDTYYFKGHYLLVEDSTGEHRPIIAKEYDRPGRQEDPQWPVLWGGCEGRVAFYHYLGPQRTHRRVLPTYTNAPVPAPAGNAPQAATTAKNGGHALAAARAVANGAAPSLRRAVSMQALHKANATGLGAVTDKNGHVDGGYIAASGNSQIITSTNATSTRSGAPTRFGASGMIDKRLAVLSKRTVPIGGPKLKRSISVDGGLAARVPPPARVEAKKPGYCENCRVKYDDFKDHVVSTKHRKFALNPKNWTELDNLLKKVERQIHPLYMEGADLTEQVTSDDEEENYDDGDDDDDDDDRESEPSVCDCQTCVDMEIEAAEMAAQAERDAADRDSEDQDDRDEEDDEDSELEDQELYDEERPMVVIRELAPDWSQARGAASSDEED